MKIVMIQSGGTRFDTHSFQHIAYLARYLARNRHEVTVIDYKHPGDTKTECVAGVTIVRLTVLGFDQAQIYRLARIRPFRFSPGWAVERVLYALSVMKYLHGKEFDVIYCNSTFVSLLLTYLFPKLREKLVYHSLVYPREKSQRTLITRLEMLLENRVAHRVSQVVVEVEQARQRIVSEARVAIEKVVTIEPGMDMLFWTSSSSIEQLREQYQLNKKTVVLFHARVIPRKGVEYFIRAANILVNEKGYRNLVFVIIGPPTAGTTPSEQEKAYIEQLFNLIQSFNLSESVKLILGWQSAEVVRDFYAMSDIYVLPTLSDLTPHTIKQAMVMAKPVVTTTASWMRYIIQDGEEALLVEPGQERSLAEAIEKLITDPELRRNMGLAGQRKAKERWDIVKQTEKWVGIFQQVYESCKKSKIRHNNLPLNGLKK